MAYIEAHQELRGHRKVRRMAKSLGVSRPAIIGHMMLLWMWALDGAQSGDLSKEDPEGIAEAAMWDGDPDQFLTALQDSKWMDGMQLHDWEQYAGRILDKRQERAEKERARRAANATKKSHGGGGVSPACPPRDGTRPPRDALPERTGTDRSGAERVSVTRGTRDDTRDARPTHTPASLAGHPDPNPEPTEDELRASPHLAGLAVVARRTIYQGGKSLKVSLWELRIWHEILSTVDAEPDAAALEIAGLMERVHVHPRYGPSGAWKILTPSALLKHLDEMWGNCPPPKAEPNDPAAVKRRWCIGRQAEIERQVKAGEFVLTGDEIRDQVRREWAERCKEAEG